MKEPFQPTCKESDESVDSFFRRRFGPHIADNMVSAMIRGIYAGDSKDLSIRAIFPSLWEMEKKYGSVIKGMLSKTPKNIEEEARISQYKSNLDPTLLKDLEDCSVWGLQGGMQSLASSLEQELKSRSNVKILCNSKVNSITTANGHHTIQVCLFVHFHSNLTYMIRSYQRKLFKRATLSPPSPHLLSPTSYQLSHISKPILQSQLVSSIYPTPHLHY